MNNKKMMTKERMLKSNIAIIEQEGGKLDDHTIEIMRQIGDGEITAEEAIKMVLEED